MTAEGYARVILFDHVSKDFGPKHAVRDVSFSVEAGITTGLIGPNGSGKTTSLRMLLGLIRPDSGKVELFGQTPNGVLADRIGYLPEERGLYRRMTVREVLRYYAELKSARVSRKSIDTWLEKLGILEFGDKRIEALSKGTAQKVQFIATVLHEPELLILDEPFSGLDPVSSDLLRGAIRDVLRAGTSIILSTHDMQMAENLCDSILMFHAGQKVLDGTREAIRIQFGEATVKLRTEGGLRAPTLERLEGVARVVDFHHYQELVLKPGADPQNVLMAATSLGKIQLFEVSTPSLHDIFVRLAKGTT
jgi:ABC-2 type transport system ATP-binding protein